MKIGDYIMVIAYSPAYQYCVGRIIGEDEGNGWRCEIRVGKKKMEEVCFYRH